MTSQFYVGLDLGQSQDYSALAVVERVGQEHGHLRHLQRYPLGTAYTDVVAGVRALVINEALGADPILVMDATGVGQPVVDMFHASRLYPLAVKIHGGDNVKSFGDEFHVPKRDLVSNLQVYFQAGKLKFARDMKETDTLIRELMNYRVKISATGHDSYDAWRDSVHDDLVIAVGLACWAIKVYGVRVPLETIENTEGWPEDEEGAEEW